MSHPGLGMRHCAAVVALTPFVLSLLVHTAHPSLPLALAVPTRPALSFDQYLVDLGMVQPTTEVRGTFVFENRSQQTVQIESVDPSCGCLQPHLSSRTVPPGQAGAVVLRMQPANESPGRKEYFADIHYTDPEPREVRVTFRLTLPERQLSVKPRALMVYQFSDQPTKHLLSVSDTRPNPAQVRKATINTPFATVALVERKISAEGGIETELEVTVSPDLPPGRQEAVVTIETTDPAAPILRVPVMMHGRPSDD